MTGAGLLAPLFLAGLAAVAIPVLVHLVRRDERISFPFPSLMFLRAIPVREHRRRTIRHWWLLALRCLIIALICLAFAQPFIELQSNDAAGAEERRDVVVLLDRSHSMAAGTAWGDAVAAAGKAIDGLESGDRGALVLFDHDTLIAERLTADRSALHAALRDAAVGHGHTVLGGAVERAGALLASGDAATKEIVVISDFQRSAVAPGATSAVPARVTVKPQPVGGAVLENIAVAAVTMERRPLGEGGAVDLSARIINTGDRPVTGTDLVLEVNGSERERRRIDVATGETLDARFRLVLDRDEMQRATIRVGGDDLPADDAFHLLVSGPTAIAVLLVQGRGAHDAKTLHLQEALRQGATPGFRVTPRSVAALRETEIDAADVIIVDDAPIPGGALAERLRNFLESGGGLLVVTGAHTQGAWPAGPDGILPGRLGTAVDRDGANPGHILRLDTLHPALAAFAGGDLSAARIYRYRQLLEVPEAGVLARYDDEAVAIAERRVGNGRALVLTTTLDPSWNTLALEPAYLPLLQESLIYLASHVPAHDAVTVGDTVDLERHARGLPGYTQTAAALSRGTVTTVRAPSGDRRTLAPGEGFARVDEVGFHEAHVGGGGDRSLVIAVNAAPPESRTAPMDVEAFTAGLVTAAPRTAGAGDAGSSTSVLIQSAWWFLLLACALLLALETLFSNRLSRREQPA